MITLSVINVVESVVVSVINAVESNGDNTVPHDDKTTFE